MSPDDPGRYPVLALSRLVAFSGLVAFLLGRAFAPALRGAGEGLDRAIAYADRAGSFASYFFAMVGLIVLIGVLMLTLRETKLPLWYRLVGTTLGFCIFTLIPRAFVGPLTERASIVAGTASGLIALLSSKEALVVPRTRALGVLLFSAGAAAVVHVAASVLAWYAGERALYGLAMVARLLSTVSVTFDAVSLLTAFAWLTTRRERVTVWAARGAVFLAFVLAWGIAKSSTVGAGEPLWQVIAQRAVDRLVTLPQAQVWTPLRYALEASAPLLALCALTAPKQIPAVASAFALALLARPTTDVPLSALALALSALATPLSARDDRGMWSVLMANSGRSQAA